VKKLCNGSYVRMGDRKELNPTIDRHDVENTAPNAIPVPQSALSPGSIDYSR
jgi:hypothetical protein